MLLSVNFLYTVLLQPLSLLIYNFFSVSPFLAKVNFLVEIDEIRGLMLLWQGSLHLLLFLNVYNGSGTVLYSLHMVFII